MSLTKRLQGISKESTAVAEEERPLAPEGLQSPTPAAPSPAKPPESKSPQDEAYEALKERIHSKLLDVLDVHILVKQDV